MGTIRTINDMTLNNDIQKTADRVFGGPALRPALSSLPAQRRTVAEQGMIESADPEAAGQAGTANEPVH